MSERVTGQPAITTVLRLGTNASPPVYTAGAIANVGDMTGPDLKKTVTETTSHSSQWETNIPTLMAGGTVKFPVFWFTGDTGQATLLALWAQFGSNGIRWWELAFTDGSSTWHFEASISDLQIKAPVKGVYTGELTLQITGQVQFT